MTSVQYLHLVSPDQEHACSASRANRADFYIPGTDWPIAFKLGGWVVIQLRMALNMPLVRGSCVSARARPSIVGIMETAAPTGSKVGGGVYYVLSDTNYNYMRF